MKLFARFKITLFFFCIYLYESNRKGPNMIKLKQLLTEQDISEYSNITNAIQAALDNYTTTSLSITGEGNLWSPKITTAAVSSGGGGNFHL